MTLDIKLKTPLLPLGVDEKKGLDILQSYSSQIIKEIDEDITNYRVDTDEFDIAIYVKDSKVIAVWYNDPLGRDSEEGIKSKLELYKIRYGRQEDWKLTINNGWMEFYTNEAEKLQIVYGIHQDVIRINLLTK